MIRLISSRSRLLMPKFRLVLFGLCLLLSGVVSITVAQQTLSKRTEQSRLTLPLDGSIEDILRFDTDLVAVDVKVSDKEGRPIRNLKAEDFRLYEDGSQRPISFFGIERKRRSQQPVAVVFALDISGSMSVEEMRRLRGVMSVFSSWLAGRPSMFAVVSFGMNVRVIQSFTSELDKFDRACDRLMKEQGGLSTHIYDAADDAIRMLNRKASRTRDQQLMKRAIVIITDGFPVGDTVAPQTVIERARVSEVSIHTITLPSFSRALVAAGLSPLPTPLDVSGLVEQTGGVGIYATDRDFTPLLKALEEEVPSSYVLAFYPTDEKRRDGQFHAVRVEAPSGLIARQSRPGFIGNMR